MADHYIKCILENRKVRQTANTHTHTHTHIHIYTYTYIYIWGFCLVCVGAKTGHCHVIHNVCVIALFSTRLYSSFRILTQHTNFLANWAVYLQKLEDL